MKHLALLAAGLLVSGAVQAAGIGASARDSEFAIFLPIDVSPALWVEPFGQYYHSSETSNFGDIRFTTINLGLGLFSRQGVRDQIEAYWGGRVAYVSEKSEFASSIGKERGFRVEPTIGASYLLTDRFSVSLEEALVFTKTTGSNGVGDTSSRSTSTTNRILFRLMF